MKKTTLLIIIAFSLIGYSYTALGQKTKPADTLKYSIQLPNTWRGDTKLLLAITELIPSTVIELADKQFCLDCDAYKWVNFYITNPVVYSMDYSEMPISNRSYNFKCLIRYSFTAYADIYHINGKLLKRVMLSDTAEKRLLTKHFSYGSYLGNVNAVSNDQPYSNANPNGFKIQPILAESKLPEVIRSEDIRKKMTPTDQELWQELASQIIVQRKMLAKRKE